MKSPRAFLLDAMNVEAHVASDARTSMGVVAVKPASKQSARLLNKRQSASSQIRGPSQRKKRGPHSKYAPRPMRLIVISPFRIACFCLPLSTEEGILMPDVRSSGK